MNFIDLGLFGIERMARPRSQFVGIDLDELTDDDRMALGYEVIVSLNDGQYSISFQDYDEALAAYNRLFEQLNTETYPVATPRLRLTAGQPAAPDDAAA